MNLFRSEEHVKNWWGYRKEAASGMLPLAGMMEIFSAPLFRERLAPDYLMRVGELAADFIVHARRVTQNNPFWDRKG